MTEIWIKLYCSDNYEVSNMGRIRSLNRKLKILSQSISAKYPSFTIYDPTTNSKRRRIRTHKAVYHSFNSDVSLGYCRENKLVVDHIDGDKMNSKLKNLELVTYQENSLRYHKGRDNKFPTYITDMKSKNYYYISKRIKGKYKVFGRYNSIEEAVKERDRLIENGWVK